MFVSFLLLFLTLKLMAYYGVLGGFFDLFALCLNNTNSVAAVDYSSPILLMLNPFPWVDDWWFWTLLLPAIYVTCRVYNYCASSYPDWDAPSVLPFTGGSSEGEASVPGGSGFGVNQSHANIDVVSAIPDQVVLLVKLDYPLLVISWFCVLSVFFYFFGPIFLNLGGIFWVWFNKLSFNFVNFIKLKPLNFRAWFNKL